MISLPLFLIHIAKGATVVPGVLIQRVARARPWGLGISEEDCIDRPAPPPLHVETLAGALLSRSQRLALAHRTFL
jgi:hypothetical protein